MIEYWVILGAVLPIFLVIVAGGLIRRANWLTEEADHTLMKLVVNLLVPALILDALLGNEALREATNVIVAPLVGFATVCLGLFAAYAAAPLFGLKELTRRRTFSFTIGIYNYGYIPIPLTVLLFDRETLGVLFLHNLGVEVAIWTVCLGLLRGGMQGNWRAMINPPILAVFAGLVVHYSGLFPYLPGFLLTSINLLAASAIPLALLLIGATMADNLSEFDPTRGASTVVGACLMKLVVIALIFLGVALLLPVSQELKRVIVLQAAMPAAVFPLIMAKHYGGHVATALRVVFWTSLVSLVTIPLWIKLGLRWIGD
jgi:malate permease and related proteins